MLQSQVPSVDAEAHVVTLTSYKEWAEFWRENRAVLEEHPDDHDDYCMAAQNGGFLMGGGTAPLLKIVWRDS